MAATRVVQGPRDDDEVCEESDGPSTALLPRAEALSHFGKELALADTLASELEGRLPWQLAPGLLVSAARQGLWHAAQRFDASRGIPFAGFAKARVAGALIDELRPERLVWRRTPLRSIHLLATLSGCSYDAPADEIKDDDVTWLTTWSNDAGICTVHGDDGGLSDAFKGDELDAEEQLDQRRLWSVLEEAIAGLDPVERSIIEGVGRDGKTLEEAARPRSKSWGSRLFAKAIATLKQAMVRAGYACEFEPGALSARSTLARSVSTDRTPITSRPTASNRERAW
jgi:RNA polymerase sigma factor FliA